MRVGLDDLIRKIYRAEYLGCRVYDRILMERAVIGQSMTLKPVYGMVIRWRFLGGVTYRVISEILDITPERVRQIVEKGVRMLRHPRRGKHLNACFRTNKGV